jgi:mannose-1-phosphate guanylyltransferase
VGDFAAIGRLNAASETNNLTVLGEGARVYAENSTGMVVSDTKRVIALIGIDDVVVVDTPDALLITTKEHAQQVKKAVESLRASGDTDVL